jgi:F-type H+-transporting ATPase subunit delta
MNETEQVRHATVLDDEARHVARVYAEALYRAAEPVGQAGEVLAELESLVGQVFKQDPGLELFLGSPAVGRDRKKVAIDHAFAGRATPAFTRFLEVLNEHGRLDMLRPIAGAYRALSERQSGHVVVHVRSAVPLTDAQRERLRADVRASSRREAVLDEAIDPSVLGGVVIRVHDWVFDASLRTRLLNVRDQIIERSIHGIQGGRDRIGT